MAETVEKPRAAQATETGQKVTFTSSGGLLARLRKAGLSLIFSSYQSGGLYLIGENAGNGLNVHQAGLGRPMGIAPRPGGGFLLSTRTELQIFTNGLQADQRVNELFDACFLPRTIHYTGALDAHDVGWMADGTPVFVNTLYNCLATPSPTHAFAPLWRPPFISRLVNEDRCHLNGLAMRDGKPAYVTAVSKSDTIDGWRDRRADGGIVIDVESGEIVASGLSMPHSPRCYRGQLWVLNSGTGEFGSIALEGKNRGHFQPLAFCPGFVRGLGFHGDFAYIGLSKPRYKRFEGLALDARLKEKDSEPWCGVQVIDLRDGRCVDWFRLDGAVAEIYDVALLEGVRTPMAVGMNAPEAPGFITFQE